MNNELDELYSKAVAAGEEAKQMVESFRERAQKLTEFDDRKLQNELLVAMEARKISVLSEMGQIVDDMAFGYSPEAVNHYGALGLELHSIAGDAARMAEAWGEALRAMEEEMGFYAELKNLFDEVTSGDEESDTEE